MKINTFMMMMITLANDHHSFPNFQKQPPTQFVYFFTNMVVIHGMVYLIVLPEIVFKRYDGNSKTHGINLK